LSEKKEKYFLFVWREAFMSELGPDSPTTRHVLHALGAHMNLEGGSCFPSIARIGTETGYSERAVKKHIALAVKNGWIKKRTRRLKGQGWKRNSYRAVIPKKLHKMVNEVHHVGKGGESGAEGGEPPSEGGEYRRKKMVNEVPISTSFSTSSNTSCENPAQSQGEPLDGFSAEPITPKQFAAFKNKMKKRHPKYNRIA